MHAKLFVRNLSWSVTERELYDLFGQIGNVYSAKIPTRREDGKPRGFAFIEMSNAESAQRAIETLNNHLLHDRNLVVSYQEERTPASGREPCPTKSAKLFVRGLSYAVTEDDLYELFQETGTIISIKIPMDRETGLSKGFGFVELGSVEEAEAAINSLNHSLVKGKAISIDYQDANRSNKPPSRNNARHASQSHGYGGYASGHW